MHAMTPGWQDLRHAAVEFESRDLSVFLVLVSPEAGNLIEKHLLGQVRLCPECHRPSS